MGRYGRGGMREKEIKIKVAIGGRYLGIITKVREKRVYRVAVERD